MADHASILLIHLLKLPQASIDVFNNNLFSCESDVGLFITQPQQLSLVFLLCQRIRNPTSVCPTLTKLDEIWTMILFSICFAHARCVKIAFFFPSASVSLTIIVSLLDCSHPLLFSISLYIGHNLQHVQNAFIRSVLKHMCVTSNLLLSMVAKSFIPHPIQNHLSDGGSCH